MITHNVLQIGGRFNAANVPLGAILKIIYT